MKKMNRILIAAAAAFALGSFSQAVAQSQMSGPNGLAASPKVRQVLSERPVQDLVAASKPARYNGTLAQAGNLAASPKVQSLARENAKSGVAGHAAVVVASTAGNADGIAASPKLREQMNERLMQFQIAPLK
jgi:hypothetical protein